MKSILTARRIFMVLVITLAAGTGSVFAQQAYPFKPMRLITPFPAGGTTDKLARLMGSKLAESWGQSVIVDNRPGGNTVIGAEALLKSARDGHSLMLTSNTHVINPNLIKTSYDALRDFTAVATISSSEQVLALHPTVPANNLKEFIALAKARPGQLNYATTGSGGMTHLAGELFSMIAGVKMQQVPYKGSAPALAALIGGEVQLGIFTPIVIIGHVKAGKLRAVAISGDNRLANLPQVPTFAEAGLPGFHGKAWFGILAPAGVPADIVGKLSSEIARILRLPDVGTILAGDGMEPFINNPGQFSALMKADLARFAQIIKTANIKFEN